MWLIIFVSSERTVIIIIDEAALHRIRLLVNLTKLAIYPNKHAFSMISDKVLSSLGSAT